MKKKLKKKQQTERLLGLLKRQEYLKQHPQGYAAVRKVHRSKKMYSRKEKGGVSEV